jgi:hypothetical protein
MAVGRARAPATKRRIRCLKPMVEDSVDDLSKRPSRECGNVRNGAAQRWAMPLCVLPQLPLRSSSMRFPMATGHLSPRSTLPRNKLVNIAPLASFRDGKELPGHSTILHTCIRSSDP